MSEYHHDIMKEWIEGKRFPADDVLLYEGDMCVLLRDALEYGEMCRKGKYESCENLADVSGYFTCSICGGSLSYSDGYLMQRNEKSYYWCSSSVKYCPICGRKVVECDMRWV